MSRFAEGRIGDFGDGLVEVCIHADDGAGNAAQFHLGASQSCRLLNDATNTRTAGERIESDFRCGEKQASDAVSTALQYREEICWHACIKQHGGEQSGCEWRVLGWLENNGVASTKRRSHLVQHGVQRRVERRDGTDDPYGVPHGVTQALMGSWICRKWNHVPDQPGAFFCGEPQSNDGSVHFSGGICLCEACLGHHGIDKVLPTLVKQNGRAAKDDCALGRRRSPVRHGLLRNLYGFPDLILCGGCQLRDDSAVELVDDIERSMARKPVSIDQIARQV